ncbi:MAG TPA: PQQ-dependent sugar dehydrogenase [Candidatus Paceibacterota bacterium]|nr:PQQ-dependent sugar dehydrogenase [Candidatus Paceibacterota bacterium]
MTRTGITLLILLVLAVGGYFGYEYVKRTPPDWAVKLVSKPHEPPPSLPEGDRAPLEAPEGFTATIFSRDVPGARVMIRDPKGAMLVSLTSEGKVVALPDANADGKADKVVTVLEGLKQPHGLLVLCLPTTGPSGQGDCILYVAETDKLKTYRYDADAYTATYQETLTTFPSGRGHFTRTLHQGPDANKILISVGSSCNVCDEEHAWRATILEMDIATKKFSVLAKGLRNSVFMATDPVTGAIWATDNGRDLIGDDIPPDEVNIIEKGRDYGWPICYGDRVHDTDFDKKQYVRDPCADSTPPHIPLQAHSAALGLAFIPEEGWPEEMMSDLLIAYHGSWNRSEPTGYKVVRFNLDQTTRRALGGPIDFLTGFTPPGGDKDDALGRPVGLLIEPGGTVYVSDDRAGAIYKVSRNSLD